MPSCSPFRLTLYQPPVEKSFSVQRTEPLRVERVELVAGRRRALDPFAEDRQPEGQQQVLQDTDVAGDHLALDFALPGHRRDVEWRAVGEADRFREPGEGADITGQPFRPDFLTRYRLAQAPRIPTGSDTPTTRSNIPICSARQNRKIVLSATGLVSFYGTVML